MRTASGFFDIGDDSAFFAVLSNVLSEFRATKSKKPEHLLLLVLGLAHLREWIAPNYTRNDVPKNAAQRFAATLLKLPAYDTLWLLASHAKHQRRRSLPDTQTTAFVETIDDRDIPIDSWPDFDQGPASAYRYGDQDIEQIFTTVASFYQDRWFSLPIEQRWVNDV